MTKGRITAHHWGVGVAQVKDGRIASVEGHPDDPEPSPLNDNIAASLSGDARVLKPAVRRGWLEKSGTPRGQDSFVEVSWPEVNELLAGELNRVLERYGNEAIFGGSYGWGSAGRFHHPQGQLKRFLNTLGGFVNAEGNYSYMAAHVIMPHIVGDFGMCLAQATRLSVIREHTDLMVMFGGIPARNLQIADGGVTQHNMASSLRDCAENGTRFVNFSPLRGDAMAELNADWIAPRPGSDVAVMMGIAHVLVSENLCDRPFLDRYTVGFDQFEAYLLGRSDGIIKTPDWAEAQSDVPAKTLIDLAHQMARQRTMISVGVALQRADYGEQPLWMAVTLAAMLGQIGLPGGGFTIGYGMNGCIGQSFRPFRWASLPQGENPIKTSIPVAMIGDMLIHPGKPYRFNGQSRRFPDIKLVWWAGGNPFHHHQDLFRLSAAFQVPETIVVNEINWTSTSRHADIVLPVAAPTERNDFAAGRADIGLVYAPGVVSPPGEARTEYEIYSRLSHLMQMGDAFTGNRDEAGWLEHLWNKTRQAGHDQGIDLPDWQSFREQQVVRVPDAYPNHVFLSGFRADPDANPLTTPSGKIEIFSDAIAGFACDTCPGHPTWRVPRDFAALGGARGEYLYLLSGQPETRLHSQLDNGAFSKSMKVQGREPVLIHPKDAAARGIADGDIVELSNERGRCHAGAVLHETIKRGCVFLWTGAWFDPDPDPDQNLCRHGNPNVLTHDMRTSELSQGPASHSAMVMLTKADPNTAPIAPWLPPSGIGAAL